MPGIQSDLEPTLVYPVGQEPVLPRETTAPVPTWTDWFAPGRFAALLALLIAVNFAPVLFGGQSFFLRDFGYFSYPLAHYHRECFWRGEIPLWNPYNSCGLPFLAQWNTLVLYPPSLIYLLLPMPWSFNFYCLVHLFCAGLGMYALANEWVRSRFAASVAGLLFAFNGLALNCLMWSNNIAALALMPWVIFCAQRAWQRGGRSLCPAVVVGAMQMLAGAPEIIFLTWLFAGSVFLLDSFSGNTPRTKVFTRLSATVALVAGLSAAQLLPFFDLLQASDRNTQFATTAWSMPAWGWANLFVPLFHSYPTAAGVYFQRDQYWVASYYLGICGLLLAVIAAWRVRNTRVWLLLALSAVSVALALGDNAPIYAALRKLAPQLGFMRFPIKFIVLFSVALPLLAAFGARWLEESPEARDRQRTLLGIAAVTAFAIAGIVWFARQHPARSEIWSVTAWSGLSRLLVIGLATALLVAIAKSADDRRKRLMALGLLLLFFLDARTHSPKTNPTISAAALHSDLVQLDPPPGLNGHRAMLTRPAYDEIHSTMLPDPTQDFLLHRQALFDNCNLLDRIPKTDGFFSLYLSEQRQVWAELFLRQSNYVESPMLDFLGVGHVNTPGAVFDWTARPSALPLVTGGQEPVFADSDTTLDGLLAPSFQPRRTAFLPLEAKASLPVTKAGEVKIDSPRFATQRIDFNVTAPENALVVLAQTFDHSWRARVDGQPTKVLRANHAFQAVMVPAGTHHVVLTYESRAFRVGVVISLALLAFVALLARWNPKWI